MADTVSTLPQDFLREYELGKMIGRGSFAVVKACVRKDTGTVHAAKIIDLRAVHLRGFARVAEVTREVEVLSRLDHPNIVRLEGVYHSQDCLVIVMERLEGEELFFAILERNHFTESEARPLFQHLCSAVAYLHCKGIVHRDIKPENCFLVSPRATGVGPAGPLLKLLDFGLAKLFDPALGGSLARSFVGTRAYLAPEVELREHGQGRAYGPPADCWSLGAVLHMILCARLPEFEVVSCSNQYHEVEPDGLLRPKSGVLKAEGMPLWDRLSETAKHLIRSLMTPHPGARMTALEALEHPWVKELSEFPEGYDAGRPCAVVGPASAAKRSMSIVSIVSSDSAIDRLGVSHGDAVVVREQYDPEADTALPHGNRSLLADMPTSSVANTCADVTSAAHPLDCAPVEVRLGLLVQMQRTVASCLATAYNLFVSGGDPALVNCVRDAAIACRQQLRLTIKLLHKVHETSVMVLNLWPDLMLALEEGEAQLTQQMFAAIRVWLMQIRQDVQGLSRSNECAISHMSAIVKRAAPRLIAAHKLVAHQERSKPVDNAPRAAEVIDEEGGGGLSDGSTNDHHSSRSNERWLAEAEKLPDPRVVELDPAGDNLVVVAPAWAQASTTTAEECTQLLVSFLERYETSSEASSLTTEEQVEDVTRVLSDILPAEAAVPVDVSGVRPLEDRQIAQVIVALHRLGRILRQLELFYLRSEADLHAIIGRGDQITIQIGSQSSTYPADRLHMLLEEYRAFWKRVQQACRSYLNGVDDQTAEAVYQYLHDSSSDSDIGPVVSDMSKLSSPRTR